MPMPKYALDLVERLKIEQSELECSETTAKEQEAIAKKHTDLAIIARREAYKLQPKVKQTKGRVLALKSKGIFYCTPCDQLYQLGDAIADTRKEERTPLPIGCLEEADVPHHWG